MLNIAINPKKILIFLLLINITFFLIYVGHYSVFRYAPSQLFDLDAESNIPTWYSSAQLLMISLASVSIYFSLPSNLFYKSILFLLVCIVFLFLAIDEVVQIHEKFNGIAFGSWMAVYIAFCIGLFLVLQKQIAQLWHLNSRAFYIGLAGIFMYLLAIMFEYAGFAVYGETFWTKAEKPLGYILEVALEEFFEMTGHSVILYSILQFSKATNLGEHILTSAQT